MEWILLILSLLGRSRASSPAAVPSSPAAPAPTRAMATTATPAKRPEVAVKVATQPAPWPVAASEKAKLPAFPGPGWAPDVPERPAVIARAVQLIGPLHKAGRHTIELVEGRWIAFAPKMHGSKKAVEAFQRVPERIYAVQPPLAHVRPSTPIEPVVMSTPVPVPKAAAPVVVAPVVSPPAPSTPAASAASTIPPTLRRGSQGPDVVTVQRLVGAEPDGKFGPKTEAAVRSYQSANGLQSDGVVGPKTWAALLGAA